MCHRLKERDWNSINEQEHILSKTTWFHLLHIIETSLSTELAQLQPIEQQYIQLRKVVLETILSVQININELTKVSSLMPDNEVSVSSSPKWNMCVFVQNFYYQSNNELLSIENIDNDDEFITRLETVRTQWNKFCILDPFDSQGITMHMNNFLRMNEINNDRGSQKYIHNKTCQNNEIDLVSELEEVVRLEAKPFPKKYFERIRVIGDGNCFFRAIAIHNAGRNCKDDTHKRVRSVIARACAAEMDKDHNFRNSVSESKQDYLKRMDTGNDFADMHEIYMATFIYKVSINILTHKDANNYQMFSYHRINYDGDAMSPQRQIYLLYCQCGIDDFKHESSSTGLPLNHYDLLQPLSVNL